MKTNLSFKKTALVELNETQLNGIDSGALPTPTVATPGTTLVCLTVAGVVGIGIGIWAVLD